MKWALISASILFLSGCSLTYYERAGGYDITALDFNPLLEKGFYVSPHQYNGKHVILGALDVYVVSEVKVAIYSEYTNPPAGWDVYIWKNMYLKKRKLSTSEVLEKMYQEASKLKGNGIMDFRLEWLYSNTSYYMYDARFTGTVIKIIE